jgi:hypothetical protein
MRPHRTNPAISRLILLVTPLLMLACGAPAAGMDTDPHPAGAMGPDAPLSFGYKTNWFAVRSQDPAAVARALGLSELVVVNWANGLAAATVRPGATQAEPSVFISPPVDDWVFVVGSSLPYPDHKPTRTDDEAQTDRRFDHLFTALAVKFPEVQFFGSYRTVGFNAWARARHARIERIFSYADGEVLANVGDQSTEERALKFPDLSGMSIETARDALLAGAVRRDRREEQLLADGLDRKATDEALREDGRAPIPDEEDTLDLAGAWSVNPSLLEGRALPPGTGFSARLPMEMRQ